MNSGDLSEEGWTDIMVEMGKIITLASLNWSWNEIKKTKNDEWIYLDCEDKTKIEENDKEIKSVEIINEIEDEMVEIDLTN